MHDGRTKREAAHVELRRRLTDGLALAGLTKTALARRAALGRTTVQLAFQADAPAPSAETVAALARALRLPEQPLLDLRRTASGDDDETVFASGLGKRISEWGPHQLEVHPAGPLGRGYASHPVSALPRYVPRDHDHLLADAVRDVQQSKSRMVVLVGSSSTGKTRACWEAVQPLADQGWRLWHPFDPTRAEAALADLVRVEPFTVVWLNEAQHYLGAMESGERIAAALHSLLTEHERQPVLILATLWPEYANRFTALPGAGAPDPHSRVRELLADRMLSVPEAFNQRALRAAAAFARDGDRLLADALSRAGGDGRVTQDLAGAPELLRRFEHSSPAARAVLEVAMDARRLGVSLNLPQAFLVDAAIDYLSENDHAQLSEDWVQAALAELAHPVHGKQAPLRHTPVRPKRRSPGSLTQSALPSPPEEPVFRLADYLEQHGRATRGLVCPLASFWDAAYRHLMSATGES
ncbi:helix-turn-helix domain-containing protein [Streptomyces sp. NBC_00271]|uniref:helix-turn-helix domain-containing protein n=1 Tax=Streptomyces sp. NBC_00271 TaxID=2975697 RepID=UPI002E27C123|nr:helix-turn-helix transcriptional regulator [Streptomyces sp. NBC_00271]